MANAGLDSTYAVRANSDDSNDNGVCNGEVATPAEGPDALDTSPGKRKLGQTARPVQDSAHAELVSFPQRAALPKGGKNHKGAPKFDSAASAQGAVIAPTLPVEQEEQDRLCGLRWRLPSVRKPSVRLSPRHLSMLEHVNWFPDLVSIVSCELAKLPLAHRSVFLDAIASEKTLLEWVFNGQQVSPDKAQEQITQFLTTVDWSVAVNTHVAEQLIDVPAKSVLPDSTAMCLSREGVVELGFKSEFESYKAQAVSDCQVVVQLKAVETPASKARPRVAITCVIDNSGSMAGSKLESVLATARFLADKLGEGDSLCILAYSDTVKTLLPLVLSPQQCAGLPTC